MEENTNLTPASPPAAAESVPITHGIDLQPQADVGPATIHVGGPGPVPAATPNPAVQAAPATQSPSVAAPIPPAPSINSSFNEQEWKSSSDNPMFSSSFILTYACLGLFAGIMFLTFGGSVNIWVKGVVMLLLSGSATFFAVKAYDSENSTNALLSMILSMILLVSSLTISSTYVYYYVKLKSIQNSYKSSSQMETDTTSCPGNGASLSATAC